MLRIASLIGAVTLAGCVGSIDPQLGPQAGPPGSNPLVSAKPGTPGETSSTPDSLAPRDPSRPTLRRLNRTEYDDTVRDLLGTVKVASDAFPADDVGYGFDNIGDVLSLSPIQLELYQKSAQDLTTQLFAQTSDGAAMRKLVVPCDPVKLGAAACAKQTLGAFVPRAFRRAVAADELQRVLDLYSVGAGDANEFERGLRLALEGVLTSPHFLFRVELDPDPTSLAVHPLSDYELAVRLSYFLWSTTPDDVLLTAAGAGSLRDPKALSAQVDRMLADARSTALTRDFAGQWLLLDGLPDHQTDAKKFPLYGAELRDSMVAETSHFFDSFLHADLPVQELMRADWTMLDARLAKHYGLPAPAMDFAKTSLTGTVRRGILGQASFLTVTSHAATTSPVKRGKWVLERLLCSAPPDPPPGVPTIDQAPLPNSPLRVRLEAHRASPACAGCHSSMDPIGFGLEYFDAIGAARTKDDDGFDVDASGMLPDGRTFKGSEELADIIADDPRFPACLAQKMFVYAIGRGTTKTDQPYLDDIETSFASAGSSLPELIRAVVLSEPFRSRRGDNEAAP